ncbi:MAG: class A beta-lactamase [Longimicrobiales bacterium]
MRRFLAMLVLTLALPGPVQATQSTDALDRLRVEVARVAASSGGRVGVAAVHVESGRAVYHNGDDPFPMASTYKVPIAVQLLTRVDAGELTLDRMVDLEAGDLHPGSGTLTELFDDPGVSLSVLNLMELMLLISDNSATDLVIRLAGGTDAVTDRMRALGHDGIRVDRPTSVLIGDFVGVEVPENGMITPERFGELAGRVSPEARESAAERFARDLQDTATPRAMADLLLQIWNGEALSEGSSELLVDVMERVSTGQGRLKGMLPEGTTVAHKTGTIGGTTNDVGIIYLPEGRGHVVTVVFVADSEIDIPARERTIAQIARSIHDFFLFVS